MEFLILNFFTVAASTCLIPFIVSHFAKRPLRTSIVVGIVVLNTVVMVAIWISIHALITTGDAFGASRSPGNWLGLGLAFGGITSWRILTAKSGSVSPPTPSKPVPTELTPKPDIPTAVYIHDSGEQRGPFALEQLNHMWRAGSVTANAMYFNERLNEWKPLRDIINA